MLPLNLSDTAATGQDGFSLKFIAAIAGRQCCIQDGSGRGLSRTKTKRTLVCKCFEEKKNIKQSQLSRLQKKAYARAEEVRAETKVQQEIAANANIECDKATRMLKRPEMKQRMPNHWP